MNVPLSKPIVITSCLIALGGLALGMRSNPFTFKKTESDLVKEKGLPKAVESSIQTLEQQLQRRFHDRNDLFFGYGRVVRASGRLHVGPVTQDAQVAMSLGHEKYDPTLRQGLFQAEDGKWYPTNKQKETLLPENRDESDAVKTLQTSAYEVSIYTAGMMSQANGKTRLKGPAYLRQLGPDAPSARELESSFQDAWKSGREHVVLDLPDGTQLRCSRVVADDASCVNCHSKPIGPEAHLAVGKPIGMFIIALKPKIMTVQHETL